ncbi:GNAT family N-acetyltransferase [Nocardia sp. NPDC050710]|uniref:GNAT family N-acetyltransferase n=1 Tax=Nocardia sp. NPDC050710 TaxID=3157220 RepID=UPI0033DA8369
MINVSVRLAVAADEPFLWAMLFEASHAAETGMTSPDELRVMPELTRYVEKWGLPTDLGVIGELDGEPLGAAWVRLLTGDDAGYGYLDHETPELAIGVAPQARGSGVGTAMLARLLTETETQWAAISLSVRDTNPAKRLYERLGFVDVSGRRIVNRVGTTSSTMVRRLR